MATESSRSTAPRRRHSPASRDDRRSGGGCACTRVVFGERTYRSDAGDSNQKEPRRPSLRGCGRGSLEISPSREHDRARERMSRRHRPAPPEDAQVHALASCASHHAIHSARPSTVTWCSYDASRWLLEPHHGRLNRDSEPRLSCSTMASSVSSKTTSNRSSSSPTRS
jgi:hypothetical protein